MWFRASNIGELITTVDKLIELSLSFLSQIQLINLWSASYTSLWVSLDDLYDLLEDFSDFSFLGVETLSLGSGLL